MKLLRVQVSSGALVLLCLCGGLPTCLAQSSSTKLPAYLKQILATQNSQAEFGLVSMSDTGVVVTSKDANKLMPSASSIKFPILLAYFNEFQAGLDKPVDVQRLVSGRRPHSALRHFSPNSQAEIVKALHGKSAREIGWIMIRVVPRKDGAPVSNVVYNAATNVAIASLGGTTATTRKIHALDKSFSGIQVNRYMLASREKTDNRVTPLSLASSYHVAFSKQGIATLNSSAVKAIREIMTARTYPNGATLLAKSGDLYSSPVTQVRAGQFVSSDGKQMNYAIMASQKIASSEDGNKVNRLLAKATLSMYESLVALSQTRN